MERLRAMCGTAYRPWRNHRRLEYGVLKEVLLYSHVMTCCLLHFVQLDLLFRINYATSHRKAGRYQASNYHTAGGRT